MNKMKLIRILVASVLAAALLAALIAIPVSSYSDFRTRKDITVGAAIRRDSETFKSLRVELKEGVAFYQNGLAKITTDDIIVKAKYGGKYAEARYVTLSPEDYVMSPPSDFDEVGGDVTVSYFGKTGTLHVDLLPLEVTEVRVVENPFLVAYAQGASFDPEGIALEAEYNDGITRTVTGATFSDAPLTAGTEKVSGSFECGDKTVTFDVPVTVTETLNDGNVVELTYADNDYVVPEGGTLASAEILARYASGNRRRVAEDDYSWDGGSAALLGKAYHATATLKSDATKTVDVPARVTQTYECENARYSGISKTLAKVAEQIYDPVAGTFTAAGKTATVVEENTANFKVNQSNFNPNSGKALIFTVNSAQTTFGDLILRTTNGMWMGGAANIQRYLKEYAVGKNWSFLINGERTNIPYSVTIPEVRATGDLLSQSSDAPAFNTIRAVFFDIRVPHIQLRAGENEIRLILDLKSDYASNFWGEVGAERLDHIRVETSGPESPHTVTKAYNTDGVAATCTENGIATHSVCDVCGNIVDEEGNNIYSETIDALGHAWGVYAVNEKTHSIFCQRCGLEETGAHEYVARNFDATEHWYECVCGKKNGVHAHNKVVSVETKEEVYDIYHAFTAEDFLAYETCSSCDYRSDGVAVTAEQLTVNNNAAEGVRSVRTVSVTYKGVNYSIPVRQRLEGEDASIVCTGGTNKNCNVTPSERNEANTPVLIPGAAVVKGLDNFKTKNRADTRSVTMTVNVEKAGTYKVRASMTNWNFTGGIDVTGYMRSVQINQYFALLVNDATESGIPDTAVISGSAGGGDWNHQFWYFTLIDLGDYELQAGENTLVFCNAIANNAAGNKWSEFCDTKIDYFTFEPVESAVA